MKKLKFVDSLKGLAVLGVIAYHTSLIISSPLPRTLTALVSQGARGVQLFFVLSAFTIFLSLNNRISTEKHWCLSFFIRRFLRIAPLFYLAMIFYMLYLGMEYRNWLADKQGITFDNIVATMLFVNGFYPYWINSIVPGEWAIAIEMTFYAIAPFLFKRITNLKTALWLTFWSFVGYAVLNWVFKDLPLITSSSLWKGYMFLWFPAQFPVFCLGIVLFYFYKDNLFKINGKLLLLFSIAIISGLLAFVVIKKLDSAAHPIHVLFTLAFVALTYSLWLVESPLFVNRLTSYLGKISYCAYLSHIAVLMFLRKIVLNWTNQAIAQYFILLVIGIVLTAIVSKILQIVIEKRFIKFGDKIISHLK